MAVSYLESGAWLNALPMSAHGVRMDDDVVRITVGQCLGVQSMGVFCEEAHTFFREVACRVRLATDDLLTHQYLVQHISVAVQRGNTAAFLGCIGGVDYLILRFHCLHIRIVVF